jgi:hypothetical protein
MGQDGRRLIWVVLVIAQFSALKAVGLEKADLEKARIGRELFLAGNLAISEGRFKDGHEIAERLIREHAGDYQIGLYLHFYAHTFYLVDEDFQKEMLRPRPQGIQERVAALKTKDNKSVLDLVKLAWVADQESWHLGSEYLEEILEKHGESIWRDWAEFELGVAKRSKRSGAVRSGTEEHRAKYRELYSFAEGFIKEHPNSYLTPRVLKAGAGWACLSDDAAAKKEAVKMCKRVLREYPSAEYHCARARRKLRRLLGNTYEEADGCSEERDRIITLFYCHTPQLEDYKKFTTEYVAVRAELEEQTGISTVIAARLEQERITNRENISLIEFGPGKLRDANSAEVLAVLARYQNDPCWPVRHLAFRYAVWLAEVQPQAAIRSEVVNQLVKGFISGADRQAGRWLLSFHAEDFSDESKAVIRQRLAMDRLGRGTVLICGVARMEDQLPTLEKLLIDEMKHQARVEKGEAGFTWYYTTGWAARLARARMGIKEDIDRCLQLVEAVEDLNQRVLRLLFDVGYIRQPEAIEYLQSYLESDKRLPPVKPTVQGELYANRVMRILVESLRNFPVEKKETHGYSPGEIEAARKWMREQKRWNIIR